MPARTPLTAYDRLFLASHLARLRQGLPGHGCFAHLDLRGPIDRDRLRAAFIGAMAAHPLTRARICYSYVTARAHWRCIAPADGQPDGDAVPLSHHDLRGEKAPDRAAHKIVVRALRELRHPSVTPQIKLFHLRFDDEMHRLVLQSPHYLMDLEGAMLFLRAVGGERHVAGRRGAGWSDHPTTPAPAPPRDEYPPGWSRRYVRRLGQGLRMWSAQRRIPATPLQPVAPITEAGADFLHRYWSTSATHEILDAARSACASAPLRYTRYFMIALLRSLEDLREDLGLGGEAYVLPLPLLRPRGGPRTVVTRNDLTIATLVVDRRLLKRTAALDAALDEQIEAYSRTGLDEATWVSLTYAGWMRIRHYRRFVTRGRFAPYSAGFSSFRVQQRWDGFLGAKIEGLSGFALPLIPPGIMITFCRHADRLNFAMAFYPHLCPTELAGRLADRLVERLGVPASASPVCRRTPSACVDG